MAEQISLPPLNVLYIDAAAEARDVAQELVQRAPTLRITIVPNSTVARAQLREAVFDVVLVEHHPPEHHGLVFVSELRQAGLPLAAVLLISERSKQAALAALQAGADDYLVKEAGFVDRLPLVLTGAVRRCRARARHRRRVRVLYVDADQHTCALTERYLAEHAPHLALHRCGSAAVCLELLERESFDVIMSALTLADTHGLDLLKAIRERGISTPVALLGERADEPLAEAVLRLGAADFLVKFEGYLFRLAPVIDHIVVRERLEREQQAMLASRERFQSLFERAHDALFVCDDAGRIVEVNAAAEVLTGLSRQQLGGRRLHDLAPTSLRHSFDQGWAAFLRHRRWDGELALVRSDGTLRSIDLGASAGFAPGLHLVALRDISDRKRVEHQLQESQIQLIHADKLAALGQLISGVAHELNNPLAGIIGYAQLLRETDLPAEARRDIEMIEGQATRARRIVNNLLTFARRYTPERTYVNINELIERTLELRAYDLRVNHIEVVTDLAADLPQTVVDPYQLQQVFLNLLLNAEQALKEPHWRAQAHDTGRIVIESTSRELPEQGLPPAIEIRVRDNGPGIAPEIQHRVFEPFFTTKPVGTGTGLGLAISYGIVHEHGGDIWIDSTPGQGTTVSVRLPLVQHAQIAEPEPPARSECESQGVRVLVIDDEYAIVMLLCRWLEKLGMVAEVAYTGREAIALLRRKPYDVLLCDLRMPDVDGQQIYAYLKQSAPQLLARTIFMTGDVASEATQRFFDESGCRSLIKPFSVREMTALIEEVLHEPDP